MCTLNGKYKGTEMTNRLMLVMAGLVAMLVSSTPRGAYAEMPGSFAGLVKETSGVVVNISATQTPKVGPQAGSLSEEQYRRYYGELPPEGMKKSLGSGVIISPDGYVLTNYHVVKDSMVVSVTIPDQKVYDAKVLGFDERTDLALLKIKAGGLPSATLGDSDALEVGDWVVAIGNPFGLSHTVTSGIVSAKGREIGAGPYDDFIQTDASINPGNSGGPLFNTKGEVVGINTAINAAAQGIGFAIPINIAKIVVRDLKDEGRVSRGWLGARAQVMTPELAEALKLKESKGVVVTGVDAGSPAESAGLKIGDVIVEFAGKKITHASELPWLVATSKIGAEVPMKLVRDGGDMSLMVKIERLPDGGGGEGGVTQSLGFTVTELTPDIARQLSLIGHNGVIVSEVQKDSQAAEQGMRPGDLVVEVNGRPTQNVENFYGVIKPLKKGDTALLYVIKQTGSIFVPLKIK